MRRTKTILAGLGACVLLLTGASAATADGQPDFELTVQKGQGCAFAYTIQGTGDQRKEITLVHGQPKTIFAGKGYQLTFTNNDNQHQLVLESNGSVDRVTTNPDGSMTHHATGHYVVILFPTDVPAGPSSLLYVGSVDFIQGADGSTRVLRSTGRTVDICAAIA